MTKSASRYALTNKDGKYLVFNQVSNDGVEVYVSDDANEATTFSSKSNAHIIGYSVKFDTSEWDYFSSDDAIPVNIVKIKKVVEVENIEKLFDKHK